MKKSITWESGCSEFRSSPAAWRPIGYDPEPQILELEFRQTGQVYQYFDVPAEEYAAFLQAESKGTHLNQHFEPRGYCDVRVRSQAEAE
jgi:hypothetical protein